jgi:uncharacterized protein YjgD (DUF1641 family)
MKMSKKVIEGNVGLEPQTIQSMVEIIDSFELLMSFFNDQAVQDVSGMVSQLLKLVNGLTSTDLVDLLERSLMDPEFDKALLNPPKVGLIKLLGVMGDEDMQKGLGILVELIKALGRASVYE